MSNPILVTALVEVRRRMCPCGAVAHHPDGLCRHCQATATWRSETTRTNRRATTNWKRTDRAGALLFARVAALVQIIGKGTES